MTATLCPVGPNMAAILGPGPNVAAIFGPGPNMAAISAIIGPPDNL